MWILLRGRRRTLANCPDVAVLRRRDGLRSQSVDLPRRDRRHTVQTVRPFVPSGQIALFVLQSVRGGVCDEFAIRCRQQHRVRVPVW